MSYLQQITACLLAGGLLTLSGCSAATHRQKADRAAYGIIAEKQREALGRTELMAVESPADTLRRRLMIEQDLPYTGPASFGSGYLEPVKHWPDGDYLEIALGTNTLEELRAPAPERVLSLEESLAIAAQNNRDYQTQKEEVFRSALALELERNVFRSTFAGGLESIFSADLGGEQTIMGLENSAPASLARRLQSGVNLTTRIGLDLVKLLSPGGDASRGLFADASIFIPLLRGAGRHIVAERLTQAEREVVYAIYDFEEFKRDFAVRVASQYFSVLQSADQVMNVEENYRGLIASARRARRLADAGRLPPIQVDQAVQNELRARDRWIRARESYARGVDSFKILLGLPTDADLMLDREELPRMAAVVRAGIPRKEDLDGNQETPPADTPIELVEPDMENRGPYELNEEQALRLALANRLDVRVAQGTVFDAQRRVVVAADGLRTEISFLGRAAVGEGRGLGSARLPDSYSLAPSRGRYSALLAVDLPLERTAEQAAYRNSLITLERAVRGVQALEDAIKFEVRNNLRNLLQAREGLRIQEEAVALARQRVRSTTLYLEAGRVQMRDLLEAQEALLAAQNALTAALVDYRISELELQRDLGLLQVTPQGLWREFDPSNPLDDPWNDRTEEPAETHE